MAMDLKFKDFIKYVSKLDRISICMRDTFSYENYRYSKEIPIDKYAELYVYGVGLAQSEFEEDGKVSYEDCIEIMLSEIPREENKGN